jgi:hypothetical protein
LKSFFGVRKEVREIKISVTPEEFLKKAWKVSEKELHRRKIVPVIIWDFVKHHTLCIKKNLLPLCVLAPPFPGRYCSKGQRSSRVLLPSKTSMYIALYVRNV